MQNRAEALRLFDHRLAFCRIHRERFLAEHCLAGGETSQAVVGVVNVGTGHVNHVQVLVVNKPRNPFINLIDSESISKGLSLHEPV